MSPHDLLRRGTAGWSLARQKGIAGTDHRGAILPGVDLTAAPLARLTLDRAQLTGARLAEADLSESRLDLARLTGADLTRAHAPDLRARGADFGAVVARAADLRRLDAPRSRWAGAQLGAADLRMAVLSGAELGELRACGVDLRDARLDGARLCRADLGAADLRGALLMRADLTAARLDGARLDGAIADTRTRWPHGFEPPCTVITLAPAADLRDYTLAGPGFTDLHLRGARLGRTRLRQLGAERADLRDADLTAAWLMGGRYDEADFTGADLSHARLVGSALPWTLLGARGLTTATLQAITLLADRYPSDVAHREITLPALAQAAAAPRFTGAHNGGALTLALDGDTWTLTVTIPGLEPTLTLTPTGAWTGPPADEPAALTAATRALDCWSREHLTAWTTAGGRVQGGRLVTRLAGPDATETARATLAAADICAAALTTRQARAAAATAASARAAREAAALDAELDGWSETPDLESPAVRELISRVLASAASDAPPPPSTPR
ncbi:MAG: pentapeptide repeat-containing protein [bacterium]